MKVTIEFDGYEEHSEILQAVHARDAWAFIWEFEHHLRGLWKHGDKDEVSVDKLWQEWHDLKPVIEGMS